MVSFSLEYFPPQVESEKLDLIAQAESMSMYQPKYMSITHSFNVEGHNNTLEMAEEITSRINTPVIPHMTCAKYSKDDILSMAHDYHNLGLESVVALRGDSKNHDDLDRYTDAKEFTQALSDQFNFRLLTTGYPEGHPESVSLEKDMDYLKEKCLIGIDEIITQWFFSNKDFLMYRDNVSAFGIDTPISAGILPISDFEKVKKFAAVCGANIPQSLQQKYDAISDNDALGIQELGQSIAIDQIENLQKEGIDNFHLYTLNRKGLTQDVIHHFNKPMKPQTEEMLKNNRKAS